MALEGVAFAKTWVSVESHHPASRELFVPSIILVGSVLK
jgi:hypothetical protein